MSAPTSVPVGAPNVAAVPASATTPEAPAGIPSSSATPAEAPVVIPGSSTQPSNAPANSSPETAPGPVSDDSGSGSGPEYRARFIFSGLSIMAALIL